MDGYDLDKGPTIIIRWDTHSDKPNTEHKSLFLRGWGRGWSGIYNIQ